MFETISRNIEKADKSSKRRNFLLSKLHKYQKKGYKFVIKGRSVFVVAPTGMGKTEIAKICTTMALVRNLIPVYLVPTVMLLHQKAIELEREYQREIKILKLQAEIRPALDDLRNAMGNAIIIATYEAFRSFLFEIQKRRYFYGKKIFGAVIIDEAHKLGERSRGLKLETMLYKIQREHEDVQFCFLSGSFERKSAENWAKKFNCELIFRSNERNFKGEIIQKKYGDFKHIWKRERKKLLKKYKFSDVEKFIKTRLKFDNIRAYYEKLFRTLKHCEKFLYDIVKNDKKTSGKMLIFTYSRRIAEALAMFVWENFGKVPYVNPKNYIANAVFSDLDTEYGREFEEYMQFINEKKVAFHVDYIHAGLDLEIRKRKFNEFMKDDKIRFLFCSPVLEVGVDIKNIHTILITDAEIYNSVELTQMIGRTREKEGNIIFFVSKLLKNDFEEKILLIKDKKIKEQDQKSEKIPKNFRFRGFKLDEIRSRITLKDIEKLAIERLFYHQISFKKWKKYIKKLILRAKNERNLELYKINKKETEDIRKKITRDEFTRLTHRYVRYRLRRIVNDLLNTIYIRSSKKVMGLTYIGEAAVESQVDILTADEFSFLFLYNNKPSPSSCINILTNTATKILLKEDPRFQDLKALQRDYVLEKKDKIRDLLQNYRWDLEQEEKENYKKGLYDGDIENYRKTSIWLAASLYLFCEGCRIHEYVEKIVKEKGQNYYEVDFTRVFDENKTIFHTLNKIYRRYQKEEIEKKGKKPGIWRHKINWRNKAPSMLDEEILKLLEIAGKNGLTVKELYMNLYGDISLRKIRAHLDKLSDRVVCVQEYQVIGRPPYRYFLKKYFEKSQEKTCKDCQHLQKHPHDRRKRINCRYRCNFKKKERSPKQKICDDFEEIERKYIQFKSFEIHDDKPKCPECGEINTLLIPIYGVASICKNCKLVVYMGERGMFEGKTGIYKQITNKIKEINGFLIANVKNYAYNLIVKKRHELRVDYDSKDKVFRFYISGNKRRYFIDAVGRIELFGGTISKEAMNFIDLHRIELIEHNKEEILEAEKRERSESLIRNKIIDRRAKGDLMEVGRQMVFAKIMSNVLYTRKLVSKFITELNKPWVIKKYQDKLLYGQLDWLLLTYLFYNASYEPHNEQEIIDIMNRLRSAEGNSEKNAWEVIKRALPPKFRFVGRQAQRYAETIFYYGAKAYDVFNACLNYLYILLQKEAGKALGKVGFNRFFPGPGILHYRANSGKRNETFYGAMTKKNKELLFDFMDAYRPPLRYYLVEMFIDNRIFRKDVWRGMDELGRELFYVSSKCKAKKKLDTLFQDVCSKKFYYKNKELSMLQIMELEAKNLAQFLKSKNNIEYIPFCAFETKKEAKWVFNIVNIIDSILGNGNIPQYIELEDEDLFYRNIMIQDTLTILDFFLSPKEKGIPELEPWINVCIIPHVDKDGFKSAVNLTFLHQGKNNILSIFPATNRYGLNYIEKVLENKVLKSLKHDMMNYIYVADIPFLPGREKFLKIFFEQLEDRYFNFKLIWFDHHPVIESENDLNNIKSLFEEHNGEFLYSKEREAYDLTIQYVNEIVDEDEFFNKYGRPNLKNFKNWIATINENNYINDWFDFYEFYLYNIFRFIKNIDFAKFFREVCAYSKPNKTKELEKFLKRRENLLKNPEKLLYFYEFGNTRNGFNYAAFELKKDIPIRKINTLIKNLGRNPENIDIKIICWTTKEIAIRTSKKIDLHNIFNKSMGHKTALTVLDPMNKCVDGGYQFLQLGQYISFIEFLSRIKICDLLPHYEEEYHENFSLKKTYFNVVESGYSKSIDHIPETKPCFPTFTDIDKLVTEQNHIFFEVSQEFKEGTEILLNKKIIKMNLAIIYPPLQKKFDWTGEELEVVDKIPKENEIRLISDGKIELGRNIQKGTRIEIFGWKKSRAEGFNCGSFNLIFCHKNEEKQLMDLICYLMLAAQHEDGLNSESVVCLNNLKFPFYKNLADISRNFKNYNIENLKRVHFIPFSDNDNIDSILQRLIDIKNKFHPKLIIVNSLITQIQRNIPINGDNEELSPTWKRASIAGNFTTMLKFIARETNSIIILTQMVYDSNIYRNRRFEPYKLMPVFDTEIFLKKSFGKYVKLYGYANEKCDIILRRKKFPKFDFSGISYPHLIRETQLSFDSKTSELQYYLEGMTKFGVKYVLFKFKKDIEKEDLSLLLNNTKHGQSIDICLWHGDSFYIYIQDSKNINLKIFEDLGGRVKKEQRGNKRIPSVIRFFKNNYEDNFKNFEEFFLHFLNTDICKKISSLRDLLNMLERYSYNFFQFNWNKDNSSKKISYYEKIGYDLIEGIHPITKKKLLKRVVEIFKKSIYTKPGIRAKWYDLHCEILKYFNSNLTEEFFTSLIQNIRDFNSNDEKEIRKIIKRTLNHYLHLNLILKLQKEKKFNLKKIPYFVREVESEKIKNFIKYQSKKYDIEIENNLITFKIILNFLEFIKKLKLLLINGKIRASKELFLREIPDFFNWMEIKRLRQIIETWVNEEKIKGIFKGNIFKIQTNLDWLLLQLNKILEKEKLPAESLEEKMEPILPIINHPKLESYELKKNEFGITFLILKLDYFNKEEQITWRNSLTIERDFDFCIFPENKVLIYKTEESDANENMLKKETGNISLYFKDYDPDILFEDIFYLDLRSQIEVLIETTNKFFENPPDIEPEYIFDKDAKEYLIDELVRFFYFPIDDKQKEKDTWEKIISELMSYVELEVARNIIDGILDNIKYLKLNKKTLNLDSIKNNVIEAFLSFNL